MMRWEQIQDVLGRRWWPWAAAGLAVLLGLPALGTGLQVDDYLGRAIMKRAPIAVEHFGGPMSMFDFVSGDPARTRTLMDQGLLPWWTLEDVRLRFFRPVTVFTHWVDYQLWPDAPFWMHAHNLLWIGLAMAAVAVLYRRLMAPAWLAGLAALLYAVDDAHSMPAGWVANRNASLMLLFGVLALLAHVRWRRGSARGRAGAWRWAGASLGLLLLSVLSNEGGIAVCAYLFAYAVFLDEGPLRRRLLTLAPYAALVVAWRLGYNAMDYGAWGSQSYIDPVGSPLRFAGAVAMRAPVLFLGQWALPPSDIQVPLPLAGQAALALAGMAAFAGITAALMPLLRRDALARFWFTGMVLSLIPICAAFPMDRLLLFVGLGGMGLVAQFVARVMLAGSRPRWPARALCWGLIAVHLVIAPLLFPARLMGFAWFGNTIDTCLASMPLDEDAAERTLVVVNAPNPFFMFYIPLIHSLEGKAVPKRIRSLGPVDALPPPVSMTREDTHTLVVSSKRGFMWLLVRDNAHPFEVGDVVELDGMTVEVRSVAPRGWAQRAAFTFDAPLDAPCFQWMAFRNGVFVPWTPPAVGESLVLEPFAKEAGAS